MPDHMPPSFSPDSPTHLDSREVRQPIDPDADRITDVRLIRSRAFEAGRIAGYEEGQRAAQTEIDGLTYERGVSDERGRCVKLADSLLPAAAGAVLVRAIRSGEPAPNT